MPLVYAAPADLPADVAGRPDAARLIEHASRLVRQVTRNDHYPVTPAGAPDPDALEGNLADAFRDAVVAQVEAWASLEVDPLVGPGGVEADPQSVGIGGATVAYGTASAGAERGREAAATSLVPAALLILQDVGLTYGQPARW